MDICGEYTGAWYGATLHGKLTSLQGGYFHFKDEGNDYNRLKLANGNTKLTDGVHTYTIYQSGSKVTLDYMGACTYTRGKAYPKPAKESSSVVKPAMSASSVFPVHPKPNNRPVEWGKPVFPGLMRVENDIVGFFNKQEECCCCMHCCPSPGPDIPLPWYSAGDAWVAPYFHTVQEFDPSENKMGKHACTLSDTSGSGKKCEFSVEAGECCCLCCWMTHKEAPQLMKQHLEVQHKISRWKKTSGPRDWATGLWDCTGCCEAVCCFPCFLSRQMMASYGYSQQCNGMWCSLLCPLALPCVRYRARQLHNIEEGNCEACCLPLVCPCCSAAQTYREFTHSKVWPGGYCQGSEPPIIEVREQQSKADKYIEKPHGEGGGGIVDSVLNLTGLGGSNSYSYDKDCFFKTFRPAALESAEEDMLAGKYIGTWTGGRSTKGTMKNIGTLQYRWTDTAGNKHDNLSFDGTSLKTTNGFSFTVGLAPGPPGELHAKREIDMCGWKWKRETPFIKNDKTTMAKILQEEEDHARKIIVRDFEQSVRIFVAGAIEELFFDSNFIDPSSVPMFQKKKQLVVSGLMLSWHEVCSVSKGEVYNSITRDHDVEPFFTHDLLPDGRMVMLRALLHQNEKMEFSIVDENGNIKESHLLPDHVGAFPSRGLIYGIALVPGHKAIAVVHRGIGKAPKSHPELGDKMDKWGEGMSRFEVGVYDYGDKRWWWKMEIQGKEEMLKQQQNYKPEIPCWWCGMVKVVVSKERVVLCTTLNREHQGGLVFSWDLKDGQHRLINNALTSHCAGNSLMLDKQRDLVISVSQPDGGDPGLQVICAHPKEGSKVGPPPEYEKLSDVAAQWIFLAPGAPHNICNLFGSLGGIVPLVDTGKGEQYGVLYSRRKIQDVEPNLDWDPGLTDATRKRTKALTDETAIVCLNKNGEKVDLRPYSFQVPATGRSPDYQISAALGISGLAVIIGGDFVTPSERQQQALATKDRMQRSVLEDSCFPGSLCYFREEHAMQHRHHTQRVLVVNTNDGSIVWPPPDVMKDEHKFKRNGPWLPGLVREPVGQQMCPDYEKGTLSWLGVDNAYTHICRYSLSLPPSAEEQLIELHAMVNAAGGKGKYLK